MLWGLDNTPITLIAARENRVYQANINQQRCALRLHRHGYRSLPEIKAELLWMDMLAGNGIAVPKPVNAADGDCVRLIDGVIVDLLTWVDGEPLSRIPPTTALYYQLGQLLAKMHLLADQWNAASGLNRPAWDLTGPEPTWDRFWENPQITAQQQSVLKEFRSVAHQAINALPHPDIGLIHADLVPDNVLISNGQLHPIDFDDGGFGHRVFDVATVTHRSRLINHTSDFADATVEGYSALRPLDQSTLPLFEALRACTYVGWNISRMNEAGGVERNERFINAAEQAVERYLQQ